MRKPSSFFCAVLLLLPAAVLAADDADVPVRAPDDAVMASPAELRALSDWVARAILGADPAKQPDAVKIEVKRQDHNVLRFGQSCMETPIRIGARAFEHGLGTHANSVIVVTLPPGAKTFRAMVGIDNNDDTQGIRGSVQFAVEIGGKEVFRTATLKGSDPAAAVDVPIPPGTRELVLKVDTTPDGPGHDQADWADARLVLDDGRTRWLDADPLGFLDVQLPFSFRYGAGPSAELLKSWKRSIQTRECDDRRVHEVVWSDPATGLAVTAEASVFHRYPAVEWLLTFENRGKADTPILENVQALDVVLRTGVARTPAVLHHLVGDVCAERSFLPMATTLESGKSISMAPAGGRPSNGAFPFFNLQYGDEGLIAAIGWSGQWAASLVRAGHGPTRLMAGMEKTRLKLHPGEKIRSPRILLLPWKGDRQAAHNRFRRLLLFHYVPKQGVRPLRLPVAGQCFDRYWQARPTWDTEAEQFLFARTIRRAGCDTYWFDAAWFDKGFPNGVGNWYCRPSFPRGMRPIGDLCHELGMKFILWFEPERVAPGSQIAREHPEFVFGGSSGGLFKLNDPAARRFLTDLLSQRIKEFGLDVYRNDFNIDPLGFWRSNDPPDRQGMTEIRYVEGHYAMWDELRSRHPGLWIDNCASGGRRIDLETCMRSVPLWRSDTSCSPGHPDWNQTQTQGLSLYIPLFTACGWTPAAYDLRSSATGGAIVQFDFLGKDFPMEQAKAALDEVIENRKYWYGDFYPLTPPTLTADHWAAYQLHRADLDAGVVLAFRRSECNYPVLAAGLRAIDPAGKYAVELIDEARQKTAQIVTGRQLASDFELRLPKKGSSLLVRYRRAALSTPKTGPSPKEKEPLAKALRR